MFLSRRHKIVQLMTGIECLCCVSGMVFAGSIAYLSSRPLGVLAHVVVVDLNDPTVFVTVNLSKDRVGRSEPFGFLMRRLNPTAAVTGTYFCTKTLLPVGDIVTGGSRIFQGCVNNTALTLTSDNRAGLATMATRVRNWKDFETVLCAGPCLLVDGRIAISPRKEGFRDPNIFATRPRTALGITSGNKLLLVATRTPLTLRGLANVMRSLGANDAMTLDGGSSTAMYYRGRVVVAPSRRLTNVISVYEGYKIARKHVPAPKAVPVATTPTRHVDGLIAERTSFPNTGIDQSVASFPVQDAEAYLLPDDGVSLYSSRKRREFKDTPASFIN